MPAGTQCRATWSRAAIEPGGDDRDNPTRVYTYDLASPVSRIITRAGVSRGMIHLHFGGKDNLLTEAARFFSEEYYAEMDRILEDCDGTPEARIMAVVEGDLSEALMNPRSTRIWHAFRGVANSHPGIAAYSSTQDDRLVAVVQNAFEELCDEDGLDRSLAENANYGVLALLEGMWVHYIADRDGFSREASAALIRRFLAGLFPGRFAS